VVDGWPVGVVRGDDAEAGEDWSTTSPRPARLFIGFWFDADGRLSVGPSCSGTVGFRLTRAGKGAAWRVEPSWLLPGSTTLLISFFFLIWELLN